MELRWYWRVLKRQARVIWLTTVLVAIIAGLYTAYTAYGKHYKATETIEFYEKPPLVYGQSLNTDPESNALGVAGSTTGNAKFYTQQNSTSMGYRTIQAGFGANITEGRQLEMEYSSSDKALAQHIVSIAVQLVAIDYLPYYNQTVLQPGAQRLITTYPVQWRVFDPMDVRSPSLSSTLISWIEKVVIGLVLGVALAFLWEYLDESIHDEHDVRNWMGGIPTLGVIPGGKARPA
jgi:hypothetical protein